MFLEKNGRLEVPGPLCNSARFKQHLGDVVNPVLGGEGKGGMSGNNMATIKLSLCEEWQEGHTILNSLQLQ